MWSNRFLVALLWTFRSLDLPRRFLYLPSSVSLSHPLVSPRSHVTVSAVPTPALGHTHTSICNPAYSSCFSRPLARPQNKHGHFVIAHGQDSIYYDFSCGPSAATDLQTRPADADLASAANAAAACHFWYDHRRRARPPAPPADSRSAVCCSTMAKGVVAAQRERGPVNVTPPPPDISRMHPGPTVFRYSPLVVFGAICLCYRRHSNSTEWTFLDIITTSVSSHVFPVFFSSSALVIVWTIDFWNFNLNK